MKNTSLQIIQDFDQAIVVMHEVGKWMEESGLQPSQWWHPSNMNKDFLLKHTEPTEYFVALIEGKPAASMVLQETERNQSWKSVDRESPQSALYIHWLCVGREFAGQGLSEGMIKFATQEARTRGFQLLRLDTNADEEKLCRLYERLGFQQVGRDTQNEHNTAFYQKPVVQ